MAHDHFSSSDSNASGNPKSLRERMSQDLQLRGMAQRTHDGYLREVRKLACHYHTPPDQLTEQQVADYLLSGMARGDFYILCPDNDVTRAMDERRIAWAAGDIIDNRPALSRWHPDHQDAFARHMEDKA